ncbi:unnamed protein product, partial [Rotaria magnacalcarata]
RASLANIQSKLAVLNLL